MLLVAAVPLLLAIGCSSNSTNATTGTTAAAAASSTTASGGSGGSGGAAGGAAVTIKDFKFGPDPITVKAGQTITFTNQDGSPHEPTAGTPTAKTGTFSVDTTANGSATTGPINLAPGTYDYFCGLHEYMVATFTVQ